MVARAGERLQADPEVRGVVPEDRLREIQGILDDCSRNGIRFRLVVEHPEDYEARPRRSAEPCYGNVADDMEDMYSEGRRYVPGSAKVWAD